MVTVTIDMTKTGENIKALRRKAGLAVCDVQEVMGFTTPVAVYKWEQGLILPRIDNLVILSALLKVPMQEIIITTGE